ncbi:MAG: hypothetical protein R3242_10420 [Akkermansiaceae bacterium]|nr:hypothetical protein [Akkermansiaceae bacterium]
MGLNNVRQHTMISGIRSARPNPIIRKREVVNDVVQESVEAARPETSPVKFKTIEFDKDYAFHYIQSRWFQRRLELGEILKMSADQLKMICDEVHEMGRLRERRYKDEG